MAGPDKAAGYLFFVCLQINPPTGGRGKNNLHEQDALSFCLCLSFHRHFTSACCPGAERNEEQQNHLSCADFIRCSETNIHIQKYTHLLIGEKNKKEKLNHAGKLLQLDTIYATFRKWIFFLILWNNPCSQVFKSSHWHFSLVSHPYNHKWMSKVTNTVDLCQNHERNGKRGSNVFFFFCLTATICVPCWALQNRKMSK